jgi:Xaa-Pro aminopeptidase
LFREGIAGRDLSVEFEYFVRKNGADDLAFDSIVAFGPNSAYPHHHSSQNLLKRNQNILIDVGAMYRHYCADVTRVFFFGNVNAELSRMNRICREAASEAARQIHPGAIIQEIDQHVRDFLKKEGVEELMTHGLGHGIGLEGHECPVIRFNGEDRNLALQENMAIAIEPGLYQAGIGGVRHENSGIVTKDGFASFYPD